MSEIERCRREQAECRDYILQSKGTDIDGAYRGLGDWFGEEFFLSYGKFTSNGIDLGAAQPDLSLASYRAFIKRKAEISRSFGFQVEDSEINPILKRHQRVSVRWGAAGGRRAWFEAFGLGKTVIQLETLRLVMKHARARKPGLIVAPLGVRQEFKRDAGMLGIPISFIRSVAEVDNPDGIYLTNYETVRDGKLDPSAFGVTSLDEAAVLRGFGGTKTFREFMTLFESVPYRFVATATPDPNEYIELLAYSAYLGIMDVSQAKAQPLDAKVLTPTGWKAMGDIHVGDLVIAGDGTATKVTGVFPQGERPVFRVRFSDGAVTEADGEHLWSTQTQYERNNDRRRKDRGRLDPCETVKTTAQIAATLRDLNHPNARNHSIPITGPTRFEASEVPVDPWLMGVLLGDACLRETSITVSSVDKWILDAVGEKLSRLNLHLRKTSDKRDRSCDYGVTATSKQGGRGPLSNSLLCALRSCGLLGRRSFEKHIPQVYLINSIGVRIGVLQGLMDTDGTVTRFREGEPQCSFTTTSERLAEDVQFLVRSLGGIATIRKRKSSYRYKGERKAGRPAYVVILHLPAGMNPFTLPRKAGIVGIMHPVRYVDSIEPAGIKPAQCIMVEHPSHLYVTDDFVVTHNTRFFKRDSTKADVLTIHPHKVQEFWLWVATWALFLQTPSDLGPEFSDEGYDVPELEVIHHEIKARERAADCDRGGQYRLVRDASMGVVDAAREKRDSLDERVAVAAEILDAHPKRHHILWHDLENERAALEDLPGVASVYGKQDDEEQEEIIEDFAAGRIKNLAAKPSMFGAGVNFQYHCHVAIFVGIGFKFCDFIQAIKRVHRFLQTKRVQVHLIYTDNERGVLAKLMKKWEQYKVQVEKMTELIREYGLSELSLAQALARGEGVTRSEFIGENYCLIHNDSIEELHKEAGLMPDNSVGLILTSIPFASMYEYSPNLCDMGHTNDSDHFWQQMDFLTPHLLRVLQPGRLACIHVKDRIVPGGLTGRGYQTMYPFHVDAIQHFCKHGFGYMGMKTIVTDVVRENNQTYRLGWSEQCKDGTKMGVGVPEYLLLFRKDPTDNKKSYADNPVKKLKRKYSRSRWQIDAHGFTRSNGNRMLTPAEIQSLPHAAIFKLFREFYLERVYDFEHHVHLGEALELYSVQKGLCACDPPEKCRHGRLPVTFMLLQPPSWHPDVWTDITRMMTLNAAQSAKGREMHLCPMQFDLADRLISQYSEEGETILDPFGGLMTVPYRALKLKRKAIGIELNLNYLLDGAKYCEAAAREVDMPTLFDLGPEADIPEEVEAVPEEIAEPVTVAAPKRGRQKAV